jgi:predicted DNA-binding transcriptional regulator YafY
VKEQIYDKIWFTEFDMEEDSDGYVILNTKQQISNKLSSWCISWWDMIEVLEPKELKHEIKEMIKAFQKNQ